MSFAPGDEVVCVDNSGLKEVLREGQHYVIRWHGPSVHPTVGDYAGVRLIGIERVTKPADAMEDPPFRAERFRPVRRGTIEIFRQMCVSKKP